jgi:hypothetical protein
MKIMRTLSQPGLLSFAVILILALSLSASVDSSQQVLIYPQPDSPLRILNVSPQWKISNDAKWHMLELDFAVENVSEKAIRAYAIRVFEGELNDRSGSLSFSNLTSTTAIIQPNQTRSEEMRGHGYAAMPQSLKIAVDFVEFVDGSTWGQDVFESAQRLEGQRAGAKAMLDRLRRIKQQSGIEAVVKAVEDDALETRPPDEKIEIWKEGFKTGVGSVGARVRLAYKNGGLSAAQVAIEKPYDTASAN